MQRSWGSTLILLLGAGLAVGPAQAQDQTSTTSTVTPVPSGGSSVRIVRLSQVRGVVRMDRNTGRGFEEAFANIPVVGGARLATLQGVAEIEFEDNSSLRLGPESVIQFTELSRTATGGTVTGVSLLRGEAYVSLEKTKGNVFALSDGAARVMLAPGTHLRLDARQPAAALAVFEGQAALDLGGTTSVVGKHQTLEVNPTAQTVSTVIQGTEEHDLDEWDKAERDYHRQKASFANVGSYGLYGLNDLGYYGSFADLPGCGNVWRPYFANAGWDPFGSGTWAYYPSSGYSWVSPYPWGWLPYHSGSWVSCGAAGWGWQPGGSWYGLGNSAVVMRTATRLPGHGLPHPVPPIVPVSNGPTLIPVNMKALPTSGFTGESHFAFRQNSAGLGVPRAELGNLHGAAVHMERHGSAVSMGFSAGPMSMQNGSAQSWVGANGGAGRTGATASAGHVNSGAPSHSGWGAASGGMASSHGGTSGNGGGGWSAHGGAASMPSAGAGAMTSGVSAGGGASHK